MKKNNRYLPHTLKTRYNAVLTYLNGNTIEYVCKKYHISRISLWRWLKRFNGTKESLIDKSHKPHKKHPNSHSDYEIKCIKDYVQRNSNITLNELWYKLKINKGYNRHITSLYRVMSKLNIKFNNGHIKNTSKVKHNNWYNTPIRLGEKWQIDVKYVPEICKSSQIPSDLKFYQYTCIDECSRERFLYWYNEKTPINTVDFIKRCIKYFGYKPKLIQTDNGTEFTYNQSKIKKYILLINS